MTDFFGLVLLVVLLTLTLQSDPVKGDFSLRIQVRSLSTQQKCCNSLMGTCNPCELIANHFCLRPTKPSGSDCSLGINSTRIEASDTPAVATIMGSEPWPDDFILNITVMDLSSRDEYFGNVLIDTTVVVSSAFTSTQEFRSALGNVTMQLQFRVECLRHYYERDCETFCKARDNKLGHFTCDSNGNAVCLHGYQNTTSNCIEPICSEGCSAVGGYCDVPGTCVCRDGWEGDHCDHCKLAEGCSPIGGFCTLPWECNCMDGSFGDNCQLNISETICALSPCESGGTCVPHSESEYSCQCVEGITGDNCENQPTGSHPLGAIIGGVSAGMTVLLTAGVIAVVVLMIHCHRNRDEVEQHNNGAIRTEPHGTTDQNHYRYNPNDLKSVNRTPSTTSSGYVYLAREYEIPVSICPAYATNLNRGDDGHDGNNGPKKDATTYTESVHYEEIACQTGKEESYLEIIN